MNYIKFGKLKIPVVLTPRGAMEFEEEHDGMSLTDALSSGKMKLQMPAIWALISEGYRLEKKEPEITYDMVLDSDLLESGSLINQAINAFGEDVKK